MSKKQPSRPEAAPAASDKGAQGKPEVVRVRILQSGVHAGGYICARGAILNLPLPAAETLEKLHKAQILDV